MIAREVIGPPECPILHRWTLIGEQRHGDETARPARVKVMLHHFLPNADDRACHDHPRPFVTIVLRGDYDDMKPCPSCDGRGTRPEHGAWGGRTRACGRCGAAGVVLRERMRAGVIRYRPARHVHRTKVGPRGCWTIVIMGPLQQDWGFFRDGVKWPWREFERRFGHGMRCGE